MPSFSYIPLRIRLALVDVQDLTFGDGHSLHFIFFEGNVTLLIVDIAGQLSTDSFQISMGQLTVSQWAELVTAR